MKLWSQSASAGTVEEYLRRMVQQMLVRQQVQGNLNREQRDALGEEAARYNRPIDRLHSGAGTIRDFEDIELLAVRETVCVHEHLVELALDEAWKTIAQHESEREPAKHHLAEVFDTSWVDDSMRAGWELSATLAKRVADNIARLPAFDERDQLAGRITESSQALSLARQDLDAVEKHGSRLLGELNDVIETQRTAVMATYRRLLGMFPVSFVESLFPRDDRPRSAFEKHSE